MLFGNKDKKIEHAIAKKNAAAVTGLFEDKDEHIAMMAIDAAGKIGGDDCMNALIPLLHHPDAKHRAAAATALAAVGNSHAAAFLSYQSRMPPPRKPSARPCSVSTGRIDARQGMPLAYALRGKAPAIS